MTLIETSAAEHVRRRALASVDRFWTADDFGADSRTAVLRELSRLAEAGDLQHVRKGLYWRGQKTRLGMKPPRAEDIVRKIAGGEGIGPAAWSASLALGLSTQHPRVETIALAKRPPRELAKIEIKNRSGRELRRHERLNRYEVALLEVLEDWNRYVDAPRDAAISRIAQWIDTNAIRVAKLVKAADTEPPIVRENLRGLLQTIGLTNDAQAIKPAATSNVRERAPLAHAA